MKGADVAPLFRATKPVVFCTGTNSSAAPRRVAVAAPGCAVCNVWKNHDVTEKTLINQRCTTCTTCTVQIYRYQTQKRVVAAPYMTGQLDE